MHQVALHSDPGAADPGILFNGNSPLSPRLLRVSPLQIADILLTVATITLLYELTKEQGDH